MLRVENAFRRYDILVTKKLKKGVENKLEIVFTPVDEVLGERDDESSGWLLRKVYMRKPQYNFGWDWALSLPGVGVFGFVIIEYDFQREIIDCLVKGDISGRIDFEFEVSPKVYEEKYIIKVEVTGNGESAKAYAKVTPKISINTDKYVKEELITYDDTPCFAENRHIVKNGGSFTMEYAPAVFICLEGSGEIVGENYRKEIKMGDYFYLPYVAEGKFSITSENSATFIECLPSKENFIK